MYNGINWQGIAVLIGSVGSFISVMVGLVFQIINFKDQRRARLEQAQHKEKLDAISEKVDALKADSGD